MSAELSVRFNRIREFYAAHAPAIEASADQWAIDPYAWDHDARIQLTPIERALWHDIRAEGAVFYPQYPVGRFFVDFANPAAKVAIECDGRAFHQDADRDAQRQRAIEALGWWVDRFTGSECITDAQETENEHGMPLLRAGEARVRMREICDFHGLRVGQSRSAR